MALMIDPFGSAFAISRRIPRCALDKLLNAACAVVTEKENPAKHCGVISEDRPIRLATLAQGKLAPMGNNGVACAIRWLMPSHPAGGRSRFSVTK